jgi:hypothetical protein
VSGAARILVSGMVSGDPNHGGAAWAVLQYVLGLRELGHDVCLVEPVRSASMPAATPYFLSVVDRFGLRDRAALLDSDTRATAGLTYTDICEFARTADVLFNVSGMLTDTAVLGAVPRRVYLDLDPAFNQLWHESGIDMRFDGHTHFATVGQTIGQPACGVPTCGREWIHTLPPVVLSQWPVTPLPSDHRGWTTVGHWRAYGSIEAGGVQYGQKAHSLRRLMALPGLTDEPLEIAMAIDPAEARDRASLAANDWRVIDPGTVAATPDGYRAFVQASKGELGVTKSGYVVSRCGWFSDRSACYLASGRPVLAQDTGFSGALPAGEGLIAFDTVEEAAAALENLSAHYDRHARRAREIAGDCLRSDRVLTRLLSLAA